MSEAAAARTADDSPLAIICGGGSLPFAVADAVGKRGRRVVLFAIRGWADPQRVASYPHHWAAVGQFGWFCRLARQERCRDVVFIGSMVRPAIWQIRPDFTTLRLLPRIYGIFRGGDDHLLNASSPFDVGQAVVVADAHVLAIEAAEGTDRMLARIAELRQSGRIAASSGRGVLVKAAKRGQDRRLDLPSIGPQTVEGAARAGLAGIAVVAGSTIVAEPERIGATADRERLFVFGVRDQTAER